MQTLTYLYNDYTDARMVMHELEKSGIASSNITFVASNTDDRASISGAPTPENSSSGAATGATVGGVVGAGAGILTAIGALAIPGFGPLVAAGVLATTLVTTTGGIVAGSLIGALTSYGIDEEDAHVYAEGVRRGNTLISVRTADDEAEQVEALMRRHGGVAADERRKDYEKAGWSSYDPSSPASTRDEIERERNRNRLG